MISTSECYCSTANPACLALSTNVSKGKASNKYKCQCQRQVLKAKVKNKQNPIKYRGPYLCDNLLVLITNINYFQCPFIVNTLYVYCIALFCTFLVLHHTISHCCTLNHILATSYSLTCKNDRITIYSYQNISRQKIYTIFYYIIDSIDAIAEIQTHIYNKTEYILSPYNKAITYDN